MRALTWTVICCGALLLLLGLGLGIFSRHIIGPHQISLAAMTAAVEREQWAQAVRDAQAAEQKWQKQAMLLSLWAQHEDVNDVAAGWAQLKIALQEQNRYEALLILRHLSDALTMICDRDAFALKNIL
ncbi:MAG: DUF4363 family protein [Clostridiales bacterium]|nr:DUF4363 family protein [Clostridiales bacterium]